MENSSNKYQRISLCGISCWKDTASESYFTYVNGVRLERNNLTAMEDAIKKNQTSAYLF